MQTSDRVFPEWDVSRWFNTDHALRLADLRGQVVLVEAFQMLCPGCVSFALPMARKVHQLFGAQGVAVIGLHTVFEHHSAMQPHALEVFLHEYQIRFPVGVDAPLEGSSTPTTMARWQLQGTPSTLLIDKAGRLRAHHFGSIDELQLGVVLGQLLSEGAPSGDAAPLPDEVSSSVCDEQTCAVPGAGKPS
ncbi:MAG: redoxin domain-containing protein [Comamonas sp.]